jgi:hypothetical protein
MISRSGSRFDVNRDDSIVVRCNRDDLRQLINKCLMFDVDGDDSSWWFDVNGDDCL